MALVDFSRPVWGLGTTIQGKVPSFDDWMAQYGDQARQAQEYNSDLSPQMQYQEWATQQLMTPEQKQIYAEMAKDQHTNFNPLEAVSMYGDFARENPLAAGIIGMGAGMGAAAGAAGGTGGAAGGAAGSSAGTAGGTTLGGGAAGGALDVGTAGGTGLTLGGTGTTAGVGAVGSALDSGSSMGGTDFGATDTGFDWGGAALRGLPGVLGAVGAHQQTQAYRDLANRYLEMGQPYRDRLAALYADPSSFLHSSEVTVPVQQGTDALARSLSVQGNPIGSGHALQELQDYSANQLFGKLGQEKDRLAGYGGLSAYNAAAPGEANQAIGSQGNVYTGLGAAAGAVFNPQPNLVDIYRAMRGLA